MTNKKHGVVVAIAYKRRTCLLNLEGTSTAINYPLPKGFELVL